MTKRDVFFAVPLAFSLLCPAVAQAALTPSEKAVVRTFVEKGVPSTASRVRSLVARPDLEPAEIAEPLRAGYVTATFDDQHRLFTEGLLFGPGSESARTSLVPAVVEGLLARAASRMEAVPLTFGTRVSAKERAATDEVLAIHGFITRAIANAGRPPAVGHDASQAIRDEAYRATVELYRTHFTAHEGWFNGDGRAPSELVRVRAQMALSLVDLASGSVPRREVASILGLSGARQGLFERKGVLLVVEGAAPEPRLEEVARLFERAPRATDGIELLLLGKASPAGLVARGRVARAGVALSSLGKTTPKDGLFPGDVKPSRPDAATVALALDAAGLSVRQSFAADESLRARAVEATARAERAGALGYLAREAITRVLAPEAGPSASPSAEAVLAATVGMLLVDAPRLVELALIRAGTGRPEPLEQLALGLALLANGNATTQVGKTGDDGAVGSAELTAITTEGGLVTAFTLAGKKYALTGDRDPGLRATIDGKAPQLTALPSFQELLSAGESFSGAGADFKKLGGDPHATGLDDGRFLVGGGSGGFDALVAGDEAADLQVTAQLRVTAGSGGLLLRATDGESSYAAVGLLIDAKTNQARLLAFDGRGKLFQLADPVTVGAEPKGGHAVTLRTEGGRVYGAIDGRTLDGPVPAWAPATGRAGLAAFAASRLEVRTFRAGNAKATPAAPRPAASQGAK